MYACMSGQGRVRFYEGEQQVHGGNFKLVSWTSQKSLVGAG